MRERSGGAAGEPRVTRRSVLRLGAGIVTISAGAGLVPAFAAEASPSAMRVSTAMQSGPMRLTSTSTGPEATASGAPALNAIAMMVAGPADDATTRWASVLTDPLARAMAPDGAMQIAALGGRDGVTGANSFEALTNPDGSTALLVPGSASLAWLAGDPRVHFDTGRWIPALASFGSAVLIARSGPGGVQPGLQAGLRVAASTASGPELPALLGLALLGLEPTPVFGLGAAEDAAAAFREGRVDAVLLTGRAAPRRAAAMTGGASAPVFSFGADWSADRRDPLLPDVPTLPELCRRRNSSLPQGALFNAWKAAAAACRLDAALVLQPLTPAALVARWRQAGSLAAASPSLCQAAGDAQLQLLPAPQCVAALAAIVADETTVLTLRRWLAGRTGWRPA